MGTALTIVQLLLKSALLFEKKDDPKTCEEEFVMMGIMIAVIVVLALIGVPMSFSVLAGSVWYFLSSGMPQTLLIQRLIMAVGDSFSMLAIRFSCWPVRS